MKNPRFVTLDSFLGSKQLRKTGGSDGNDALLNTATYMKLWMRIYNYYKRNMEETEV